MAGLPGIAQADRMPSQRLWPLGRHLALGFYDLPSAPDQQQGKGYDAAGMEAIGQNIAGIESNPKHQNLDIQKLEQEAVPAGQGPGVKVVAQAETASSIKTDAPIVVSSLFQAGPVRPARRICKAR